MFSFIKKCVPNSTKESLKEFFSYSKMNAQTFIGKLVRFIYRPALPVNKDGRINLHLGCGVVNHSAFINVDLISLPHIHYVRRIDDLSIFRDESIDLIYACHCLEHFAHKQVCRIIGEWARALKKGGILRLSVPDFDLMLNIYEENEKDIENIALVLMGGQDYKYNFHYTVFTESRLEGLLRGAGFENVEKWEPGETTLTTFDDWSKGVIPVNGKDYPVSLNLQARKI